MWRVLRVPRDAVRTGIKTAGPGWGGRTFQRVRTRSGIRAGDPIPAIPRQWATATEASLSASPTAATRLPGGPPGDCPLPGGLQLAVPTGVLASRIAPCSPVAACAS